MNDVRYALHANPYPDPKPKPKPNPNPNPNAQVLYALHAISGDEAHLALARKFNGEG